MTEVTNAVERFGRYLKREEGLSATTIYQYVADVKRLASWLALHGVQRWDAVDTRLLRRHFDEHDYAPARGRRLLSSWCKFWIYLGEIEGLSMQRGPEGIKKKKLRKSQPKYLTPEEIKRLIGQIGGRTPEQRQQQQHLIAFLYGTGCRISEVLNLTMRDIQYKAGKPHLIRVLGKGEKERTVYLSPTAQQALRAWLKKRATVHVPGEVVFCFLSGKKAGRAVNARSVSRAIQQAGILAGLPVERLTPHKLRHSHATALIQAGRRLEEVQEILGHSSIATTRIYAHLEPERLEAAAASLPEL